MGKIKILLVASALFFSSIANAEFIDNGNFTTDTETGLDWLDLTATVGLTPLEALAQYPDYEIATEEQFQTMFGKFEVFGDGMFLHDYPSIEFRPPTDDRTRHTVDNAGSLTYVFGDLFGYTDLQEDVVDTLGWYDEDGIQRIGGVNLYNPADSITFDDYIIAFSTGGEFSDLRDDTGTFLVRSATPNASIISAANINTEYAPGLYADLQGLEWLKFDESAGMSRNDVEGGALSLVAGGRWRYATRSETEILLGSLWDRRWDWWSNSNYKGAHWFLTTFGTLQFDAQPYNTTDFNFTQFFFGDDNECEPGTNVSCHGLVQTMENWAGAEDWTAIDLTDGIVKVSYARNSGQGGFFNEIWGGDHGVSSDNRITTKAYNSPTQGSLLVRAALASIAIDIKPGNDHNNINPNSKKRIAVAILGSIDFDATQIVDFTTVRFGPAEAPPIHDGNVEDVNGDGFMDRVFQFKTQETGIACGDTEATLTGETFGGIQFTGTDSVTTVGCK